MERCHTRMRKVACRIVVEVLCRGRRIMFSCRILWTLVVGRTPSTDTEATPLAGATSPRPDCHVSSPTAICERRRRPCTRRGRPTARRRCCTSLPRRWRSLRTARARAERSRPSPGRGWVRRPSHLPCDRAPRSRSGHPWRSSGCVRGRALSRMSRMQVVHGPPEVDPERRPEMGAQGKRLDE